MSLRIERIDFQPWGCFEDFSLSFTPEVGAVDLIYGPNATGKSTTSRGERSLLYGIDERTPDGHTHDYGDLRIGARLLLNDVSVELARRKRRVDSLLDGDGEPLAVDPIAPALGGLSAEVYRELFQVDHETLVRGGLELLEGGGEIGASLFAAAAGIATLHGTLATLDGETDRLYSKRASSRVLNRALRELREQEKRMRDSMLRPKRHADMSRALRKTEEAAELLRGEMRQVELRTRAIERKRGVAPLLDSHADRSAELTGLVNTPDLADSAAGERSEAQGRLRVGATQRERIQDAIAKLGKEIGTFEADDAILGRAEEIRSVNEDASAIRKAAADRRKREGELAEAEAGLRVSAATVGVEPNGMESLRRPATARRALDSWIREHDEVAGRRVSARERLREAERGKEEARAAFDAIPMVPGLGALEAALTNALKADSLDEQISELRLQVEQKGAEREKTMERLMPSAASLEEFRTLTAPSREEVERAVAAAEDLRQAAEALSAEASALRDEEIERNEAHDRLVAEGAVPSATVLAEARALRDGKWSAICDAADAGAVLATAEAEDFQRAVLDVDQLADMSISGATQIERSAAVIAKTKRLEAQRAELADRDAALESRAAELAESWGSVWERTGLTKIDVAQALDWLDQRAAILELDLAITNAEGRLKALSERERAHMDAVGSALDEIGIEVGQVIDLKSIVARAQIAVEEGRKLGEDRAVSEAAVATEERTLAAAKREQELAETAWLEWEGTWDARRKEAGLPGGTTVEAASETVRAVDEGLGYLERVGDLKRRIAGIDDDREKFESKVRELCGDLAPSLTGLDAERGAAALHERLVEQEGLRAQHESLLGQSERAKEELAACDGELEAARVELDALLAAAGCESVEELPEVEQRAGRARALRAELSEIERQVAEVGEGQFAELVADSADFDRSLAAVEVEELREQAERLRNQRDELTGQVGEEKAALSKAEADDSAVLAAQEVELVRSRVEEAAIAYAKAKLSAAVVRRAMERYRSLHQAPMLKRANELFTKFTLETFVELFVDVDEDGEGVLFGREHDGVRKVVEQMSKGTREQLFLALRIAAIERYVETSGPVPVIFDDVFIESDEPRSEQIFSALGELAARTQVIVLTHHHHLIEVGRRALQDRLLVQGLPDVALSVQPPEYPTADTGDAAAAAAVVALDSST